MQPDLNLGEVGKGLVLWHAGMSGHGEGKLVLQDHGQRHAGLSPEALPGLLPEER